MTKAESYYTRKLCRSLEAQGAMTYPIIASEMSPPGWPDRYVAHVRWRGMFEAKAIGGKLSPDQVWVLNELAKRGENVCVLWFSKDWNQILLQGSGGKCSRWGRWSEFFDLVDELE